MYYWALHHTTAINVAIIQAVMPVMVVGLNFALFAQRVRWMQMVGVGITVIGACVIVTRGQFAALATLSFNVGDIIMLGALALYSLYTVALRYKPEMHWMSVLFGLPWGLCSPCCRSSRSKRSSTNRVCRV